MNRSTPRNTRAGTARTARTAQSPAGSTPLQAITTKRPSVTTTLSTAYGAPGQVKAPSKVVSRPAQNMLDVMRDMVEEDEPDTPSEYGQESESTIDQEDEEEAEDQRLIEFERDREQKYQQEEEEDEEDEREEEGEEEDEDEEEVDEVEIDDDSDDEHQRRRSHEGQPSSPFAAITNKIKNLWSSSARDFGASFVTEDKIASEARIARPREPLARILLRWKEKLMNRFEEYGGSHVTDALKLLVMFFVGTVVLLLAIQTLNSAMPENTSFSKSFLEIRQRIATPVHELLDRITSPREVKSGAAPTELDLSQLKALKDSTTAQFKHLRARLDNIESTYNKLAKKVKTPVIPERKVNLFSPGSGMTIEPYLTSPTRAQDKKDKNLVTKWFTRTRGYPQSVVHGPLSAFMPWEDMGDCWCSPDSGGRAQLVVELSQPVFPRELVVEHVAKDATLEVGSAPKNIELWGRIPDLHRRNAVLRGATDYDLNHDIDDSSQKTLQALDETWVRLGRWTYDIKAPSNIQTFDVRIPLKDFNAPMTRFAFRSTSNWGPAKYVCLYRLKLHGDLANTAGVQDSILGY